MIEHELKIRRHIVRLTGQTMSNFYCKYCKKDTCTVDQYCRCFEQLEKLLYEFATGKLSPGVENEE
jgi:hypothetical protein